MNSTRQPSPRPRARHGFSAVEILAVATIIAILSLILVPILRGRVDNSRYTAARWEMSRLGQQLTLAQADTGQWPRLQDMDNTDRFDPTDPATPADPNRDVPFAYNGTQTTLSGSQRAALAQLWKGPYFSANNSITIQDLADTYPLAINTYGGSGSQGPIYARDDAPYDESQGLYPLDPWGNPYFYFTDTSYGGNVIYSMGPNGLPADVANPTDENYFPFDPTVTDLGSPGATDGLLGGNNEAVGGAADDLHWNF